MIYTLNLFCQFKSDRSLEAKAEQMISYGCKGYKWQNIKFLDILNTFKVGWFLFL